MKTKKLLVLVLLDAIVFGIAYLLFWPVPIAPVAWTPPSAPSLTAQYQQNSRLAATERIAIGGSNAAGSGYAPEDVAIDTGNRMYSGLDDGRIMRTEADGANPREFANTHGRPLGLAFDRNGNLIVADAIKGLLSIAPNGSISVLTTEVDGVPFGCTNDLDIAADGTIYFTDASNKFPLSNFKADILEHEGNGRFMSFDPKNQTMRTLLSGLSFANGVAVSPDQSFVLVVETGAYRVHRYWLDGPRKGQSEIFINNLPGFPDGILSNGKDKFWLAIVTPRDQMLDRLLPHPFLRKIVYRLPGFLQPAPKRYSFVLGLDLNGKVVDNLQNGAADCFAEIANVVEHDGVLYFGSIGENSIGKFKLP